MASLTRKYMLFGSIVTILRVLLSRESYEKS